MTTLHQRSTEDVDGLDELDAQELEDVPSVPPREVAPNDTPSSVPAHAGHAARADAAPADALSGDLVSAGGLSAGANADTVPTAHAVADFDGDPAVAAFLAGCASRAAALAGRAWDNLAHIEAFAQSAKEASDITVRHPEDAARRALVHALWPLLPVAARQGRAGRFRALPVDVASRGPDFRLAPGDVPAIAPSWTAFLGVEGAAASLEGPGAGPFLVPRGVCPQGAAGAATAVVLDEATRDGWRAHVPMTLWNPDGPTHLELRAGPDGKPLLGTDGRPQAITVPSELLHAWLFSAGTDARGLDLRRHDDRALLLLVGHLLRDRVVYGKSASTWLEQDNVTRSVRIDVVNACIDACYEAVASFTADPLACRITLRARPGDGGWTERAATLLDDTGLFWDVAPRSQSDGFARDIVWLDAFLRNGCAAGRLSALAAGRTFARLVTSILSPLGVLTQSGLRDASGDVVLQRLLPPTDGDGALELGTPLLASFGPLGVTPLWEAWRHGRGQALPDPRQSARHDIRQMPAWLTFFLESIHGPGTAAVKEDP